MTNKSITLIMSMKNKNKEEKQKILEEVILIEFKKIKAQARIYQKEQNKNDDMVQKIINCENSIELYNYLNALTVIDISKLTSYGIDVNFMNLIKVSE